MSFLDKLLKRSLKPSEARWRVREEPGPLTAHEAWAFATADGLALDPNAKLLLITSGTDIRPDGRSFYWEFLFALTGRDADLLLSYGPPDNDGQGIDDAPVSVIQRIAAGTRRQFFSLPFDFRDSPEVVEELSRKGVDFVSGQTDMKLEGRPSLEGRPAWVTVSWGQQIAVPFSVSAG